MDMDPEFEPRQRPRLNLSALQEPRNLAIAAFLAGLVIGLVVLGWWLLPVQWENASAQELRADLQVDYMRMAIDSYNLREDQALANQRLAGLGDAAPDALATVAAAPGDQSLETIARFQEQLGVSGGIAQPTSETGAQPTGEGLPTLVAEEPSGDTPASLFSTRTLLLIMCSVTGMLGAALAVLYVVRRRQDSDERPAVLRAQEFNREAKGTDYGTASDSPPLSQWMTTYLIGDDLFDDSFSIDSVNGEFLGECGVGIAETIGVGDPKRVSAFEIWLFDKNDIQTVTKVLMSNHVFRDDAARDRLSAKGEPVLASPGVEAVLETETLQMIARVVDMEYGEGALPQESFFERATLELAVWSKI